MTKRITVQNQIDMKFWRLVIVIIDMLSFYLTTICDCMCFPYKNGRESTWCEVR